MSLRSFFHRSHQLPIRMFEIEFDYTNGRGEHEMTLAYVVATNETKALLELKEELLRHHCELRSVNRPLRGLLPEVFDDHIHERWPDHVKSLVSKQLIRDHEHHVYVLPPIQLMGE